MPTVPIIPGSAPFSNEQRAWLNGFLAGLLSHGNGTGTAMAAAAESKRPLLIAFGSQSGNAECLAKKLGREAAGRGFATQVVGLDSLQSGDLVKQQNLLLITSTWGEGDMPDNAATFWEQINQNGSSPQLTGLKYSVLALGDKNYGDTFCLAGRMFDERLEQLGAQRVHPRVDCDVEFDEQATQWSEAALAALLNGSASAPNLPSVSQALSEVDAPTSYSKKNPFAAKLLTNIKLNSERSSKDTRHIAFSLAGSGLNYETGDALGVRVQNDHNVVSSVIEAHQLDAEGPVNLPDGGRAPLHEALCKHYEIRSLLGTRPEKPLTAAEFVDSLKKLQPRLYSIASSLKAHPDEVHLCVAAVRYDKVGVMHQGVASTFLADRLALGDTTGVFIHTAKHFRVPANGDTPIIMVGPGTGIAPFRAFLEERRVTGARGKNWLFFGDQKRGHDFLYHDEIQAWAKDGHLTRLDTAFSRDQEQKIYVQNRMMDAASELWQWLEAGAYFYVCGDASRMAKEERIKHDLHPFDAIEQLTIDARWNAKPEPDFVFRYKWNGLFWLNPVKDGYMCRLRIPGGTVKSFQLRELAAIARELTTGYIQITTRNNFQIRLIEPKNCPEVLRRIQSVGLHSKGAGADNIRNITMNPCAGYDPCELLDVRPLVNELATLIIGSKEFYDLPRKFNIAYDGGGLISSVEDTNDIGASAVEIKENDQGIDPGLYFRIALGGVTGHQTFASEWGVIVKPAELNRLMLAILRVFIRDGDRTNRKKARLKYLIEKRGLDGFRDDVEALLGEKLTRLAADSPLQESANSHSKVTRMSASIRRSRMD